VCVSLAIRISLFARFLHDALELLVRANGWCSRFQRGQSPLSAMNTRCLCDL
jgi:hypothetical protein